MDVIKFYMYTTENYSDDENSKDLEEDFKGLKYSKCVGLESRGAIKNKYTEDFAEESGVRVFIPDVITHKTTDITFTFLFIGDNRRQVFEDFYNYVSTGIIYYHDTVRMKQAKLCLMGEVKPTDDVYKGSTKYISADFKFSNLWGKCKDLRNN